MSIRQKLGILYLVFFLVTIIGFGGGLMKLLVDHVETEIGRTLQSRASAIVRIAEAGMTTETTAKDVGNLLHSQPEDLIESDVYLQVLDPTGSWVASSINLHGQRLPVTSDALKAKHSQQNVEERVPIDGRYRLRILTVPIVHEGRLVALLQASRSMYVGENTLAQLGRLLIAGSVVVAIIGGLSALYLTSKAMDPVADITRTAEAIYRQSDLGRRINAGRGSDELSTLGRTFNRMLDHIEEAVDNQQRFIGDASHELQTPLTVIRGNAELLTGNPQSTKEAAPAIIREADRMQRIVDDLLAVTELDIRGELHVESIDMHSLVKRIIHDMQPLTGHRSITLHDPNHSSTFGDEEKIELAIRNLLRNAITATSEKGIIEVHLEIDNQEISIKVRDDGHGIPPDHLAHVFDRFYRIDRARSRKVGGTGLGLTIVRGVAESHGGNVTAGNSTLGGAEFEIRLPLKPEPRS